MATQERDAGRIRPLNRRERRLRSRLQRRLGKRIAAAAAIAVLGSMQFPQAAVAFPNRHKSPLCDDNSLGFIFAGSNWGSYKSDWVAGAQLWNSLRDANNDPGTAWYFHGIGNEYSTTRLELGGTLRGHTTCDLGDMWFQLDDDVLPGNETKTVAAHEAGHGQGMEHSDAYALGGTPIMASCVGATDFAELRKDDYAYAAEELGVTLTANSSFESGTKFWSAYQSSLTPVYDSSGPEGDVYARMDATGPGAFAYQSVRYVDPSGANSNGFINARVNYKDANASVSGTLTLQLQARRLDYPSGSNCEHIPNLDLNAHPTFPNGPAYVDVGYSRTVSVSDGWNYADLPSSWTGAASWEGVDLRLKVYKNTNGPIFLDHTRAYQT